MTRLVFPQDGSDISPTDRHHDRRTQAETAPDSGTPPCREPESVRSMGADAAQDIDHASSIDFAGLGGQPVATTDPAPILAVSGPPTAFIAAGSDPRYRALWKALRPQSLNTTALVQIAFAVLEAGRRRTVDLDYAAVTAGYKSNPRLRLQILQRDDHTCQWCGTTTGPMHVDHIVPRRWGGNNSPHNLQTLCQSCNLRKGATVGIVDVLVRTLQENRELWDVRAGSIKYRELGRQMKKALTKADKQKGQQLAVGLAISAATKALTPLAQKAAEATADVLREREEERISTVPLEELRARREEWKTSRDSLQRQLVAGGHDSCAKCAVEGATAQGSASDTPVLRRHQRSEQPGNAL